MLGADWTIGHRRKSRNRLEKRSHPLSDGGLGWGQTASALAVETGICTARELGSANVFCVGPITSVVWVNMWFRLPMRV